MFNLFVNFIQFIVILKCVLSIPLLTTEHSVVTDGLPYETQHAVCKVFTKEIEATAKATITRQLKGVCSSRDLNLRFDELHQELQKIKQALGIHNDNNIHYKNLVESESNSATITSDLPIDEYSDYAEHEDTKHIKKDTGLKDEHNRTANRLSKYTQSTLNEEISTFNDTVVESSEGDLYFYYWKIVDVKKVLKRRDVYVTSPDFSVLGHTLHLQFYPNYMNEYIGIVLKPQSNSFLKKHKLFYLGQRSTQNEISSSTLYGVRNEDKIFKIEPKMLNSDFISSGSLLVKVKIYLNS